jgi:hypothetical protein
MAGAVLDTMAAAIGRHNGTLMASVYATRPSAAAITQGDAARGPDAIRARYAPWDTASAWSGQVAWADRALEPLGPDAILATATFTWSQLDPSGKRVEFPAPSGAACWCEGARWRSSTNTSPLRIRGRPDRPPLRYPQDPSDRPTVRQLTPGRVSASISRYMNSRPS